MKLHCALSVTQTKSELYDQYWEIHTTLTAFHVIFDIVTFHPSHRFSVCIHYTMTITYNQDHKVIKKYQELTKFSLS